MSTEASAGMDEEARTLLLQELLRKELVSIPIEHWGYFFPFHVAVWRFIQATRPGVLGELQAGFDKEPYFKGRGSDWFCGTLGNHGPYLDALEAIMYPLADALGQETRERGFLLEAEGPTVDLDEVRRLADVILAEVDEGVQGGLISV
jgi:hypothetical protein